MHPETHTETHKQRESMYVCGAGCRALGGSTRSGWLVVGRVVAAAVAAAAGPLFENSKAFYIYD